VFFGKNCSPCARSTGRGNDFELIPTVYGWKANIPQACQPVMTFRDLYSLQRNCGRKSEIVDCDQAKLEVFWKKRPLTGKFPKKYSERTHHLSESRLVCKVVRYLPDKKKQNFGTRSLCRLCDDRAQNLSGPAPNNKLGVPQISSKSVHLRRSYSRTREHR